MLPAYQLPTTSPSFINSTLTAPATTHTQTGLAIPTVPNPSSTTATTTLVHAPLPPPPPQSSSYNHQHNCKSHYDQIEITNRPLRIKTLLVMSIGSIHYEPLKTRLETLFNSKSCEMNRRNTNPKSPDLRAEVERRTLFFNNSNERKPRCNNWSIEKIGEWLVEKPLPESESSWVLDCLDTLLKIQEDSMLPPPAALEKNKDDDHSMGGGGGVDDATDKMTRELISSSLEGLNGASGDKLTKALISTVKKLGDVITKMSGTLSSSVQSRFETKEYVQKCRTAKCGADDALTRANINYYELLTKLEQWNHKKSDHVNAKKCIIEHLEQSIETCQDQIEYWTDQVVKCDNELRRAENKLNVIDMTTGTTGTSSGTGLNDDGNPGGGTLSSSRKRRRRQLPSSSKKRGKRNSDNNDEEEEEEDDDEGDNDHDAEEAESTVVSGTQGIGIDLYSTLEQATRGQNEADQNEANQNEAV